MSWAGRRKGTYLGILFILVLIGAVGSYLVTLYQAPSCTDGKQNGTERGIDCSGECLRVCEQDAISLAILWSRSFEVDRGVWNAAAYTENQNADAGVREIAYRFRLYESGNILVAEREGQTYVAPRTAIVVVEPSISVGERIPVRTTFEFIEVPLWERIQDSSVPSLSVRDSILQSVTGAAPRVTATVVNNALTTFRNVEAVVVVYDSADNAIATSKTVIETLRRGEARNTVFTWPKPFTGSASRVEVRARAPLLPR